MGQRQRAINRFREAISRNREEFQYIFSDVDENYGHKFVFYYIEGFVWL